MIAVTIYSRPGCHLCDEMKATVMRVAQDLPVRLADVNIEGDSALEEQYGLEIPVLFVEGRKAAKYRIGDMELRRLLLARAAEGGGSDGPKPT